MTSPVLSANRNNIAKRRLQRLKGVLPGKLEYLYLKIAGQLQNKKLKLNLEKYIKSLNGSRKSPRKSPRNQSRRSPSRSPNWKYVSPKSV